MPIDNKTKLGWIKKQYTLKGYTQKEFSRAIGCSITHLSHIVNCHRPIHANEMQKIAVLLDVQKSDIGRLFDIGISEELVATKPRRVLRFVAASQLSAR